MKQHRSLKEQRKVNLYTGVQILLNRLDKFESYDTKERTFSMGRGRAKRVARVVVNDVVIQELDGCLLYEKGSKLLDWKEVGL